MRYASTAINTDTDWTNAIPVTTGIPIPKTAGQPETMTATGLFPSATYFFAVRAQDAEPNLGALSNSPSAIVKAPSPVPLGSYDDPNAAWTYTGNWSSYSGAGPYLSTLHYSSSLGDYAQITFAGQRFVLTYTADSSRGNADVYVDGVKVGTINAYSPSTTWQTTWASPLPLLSAGTHTVRFVHASGTYIDVDAIQVNGP